MSSTLYRKYRPQTFSDVVDQNHIKITLQNELRLGRPAHAYLFSGPRGVGKTTLARIFAKSLNCLQRSPEATEPCTTCLACAEIAAGRFPDVIEIDAASNTGVDHVRMHIIENSRFAPQMGAFKVFIIDEVHMLSTSAFNALLKTLEEPPANVVFILATTELHKVPETIISRCQRFDFRIIAMPDLVLRLERLARAEGFEVDPAVLNLVASRSGGYLRDAESTLGQLLALGEKTISLDQAWFVLPRGNYESVRSLILDVYTGNAESCIRHTMECSENGTDMKVLLGDVTRALRELYLYQAAGIRSIAFEEYFGSDASVIQTVLQSKGVDFTLRFLEECIRVFDYFRSNVPETIIVELALLKSIELGSQGLTARGIGMGTNPQQSAAPVAASSASLTHEEVETKWPQVLAESGSLNHSLKLILGSVKPLDAKGGWFRIESGYDLHAQKLSDQKIRTLVESIIERVYGAKLRLSVEKNESLKGGGADSMKAPEAVDELMKNFGGKIE